MTIPCKDDQYKYGKSLFDAGKYEKAFPVLVREAIAGNADAQYLLGVMYKKGLGVVQDNCKMAEWFQKAADSGYSKAQIWQSIIFIKCQKRRVYGAKDDAIYDEKEFEMPRYPRRLLSDDEQLEFIWKNKDGVPYHVRVKSPYTIHRKPIAEINEKQDKKLEKERKGIMSIAFNTNMQTEDMFDTGKLIKQYPLTSWDPYMLIAWESSKGIHAVNYIVENIRLYSENKHKEAFFYIVGKNLVGKRTWIAPEDTPCTIDFDSGKLEKIIIRKGARTLWACICL